MSRRMVWITLATVNVRWRQLLEGSILPADPRRLGSRRVGSHFGKKNNRADVHQNHLKTIRSRKTYKVARSAIRSRALEVVDKSIWANSCLICTLRSYLILPVESFDKRL